MTGSGGYALAAVLAIGAVSGAWYWCQSVATDRLERRLAEERAAARDRETVLLAELEEERARRKVIYVDRIQTIREAPDPAGCADMRVPDGISDSLRTD